MKELSYHKRYKNMKKELARQEKEKSDWTFKQELKWKLEQIIYFPFQLFEAIKSALKGKNIAKELDQAVIDEHTKSGEPYEDFYGSEANE